jgi:uncharacterized protein (DUF1499 family)
MQSKIPSSGLSWIALYGFTLAVLVTLTLMLAGVGTRLGFWNFRVGFSILKWGAYTALVAAIISMLGCIIARPGGPRKGFVLAVMGLVISLTAMAVPWQWKRTVQRVPPIHDISTDLDAPPPFRAILPLRKNASNPAYYGGPGVAAQQREAYPDLAPAILDVSPDHAFEQALLAAREMGWKIVQANPAEGRLEATDTTFWFGFKDDVVVRISPQNGGSRIDVRSVSRVGRSDAGTNARRIESYLKRIPRGPGR